jgi:hypothetical protein
LQKLKRSKKQSSISSRIKLYVRWFVKTLIITPMHPLTVGFCLLTEGMLDKADRRDTPLRQKQERVMQIADPNRS